MPSVTVSVTEGSSVVTGIVAHELGAPDPVPLIYMAVERPAMHYGYARVVLPMDEESSRLHYDLDVRHLFFDHEPTGRVWLLGLMGEATSTPTSLRMPERGVAPTTVPTVGPDAPVGAEPASAATQEPAAPGAVAPTATPTP